MEAFECSFFCCYCSNFFSLKALSPGAVALLRIRDFLLKIKKTKSEKLRNISECLVVGKEEVAQRRAWARCERALLPHHSGMWFS